MNQCSINTDGKVVSYNDVTCLLSANMHDGTCMYWWRVKASGEVLYGKFDVRTPSQDLRLRVIISASQTPSRAAEVIGNNISSTEWVDPMKPPFIAPSELSSIDCKELRTVKRLTPSVDLVLRKGIQYIHKFMNYLSHPSSFENEIRHHQRVLGTRFVPRLCNVVTVNGKNRGLLLEFIDGDNLSDLASSLNHSQLYPITAAILEAISDFETRGYYPQDLKCANMVLRNSDRSLFVVDLGGGFSEGMHMREALQEFGKGSILPRHMLYTLGRTIWELWIDDIPPDDKMEEAPDDIPPLIRALINDCCRGVRFKTVTEAKDVYFQQL
jgi:serine/threonine protein kinase